jgi:hypothetical protein
MPTEQQVLGPDGRVIGHVARTEDGRWEARHELAPLGLYRSAQIAASVIKEFAQGTVAA